MTSDIRWPTVDLPTPLGTYTAGTEVYVLDASRPGSKVCLDPDMEHRGRCHTATIPNRYLTRRRESPSLRDPIINARRAALDEARPSNRRSAA